MFILSELGVEVSEKNVRRVFSLDVTGAALGRQQELSVGPGLD